MRESKYRGKSLGGHGWVYGNLVTEGKQSFIITGGRFYPEPIGDQSPLAFMNWYEVDSKTVGQYTNKNDINGIEIYDGDILKVIEKGYYGGEYLIPVKWIEYSDEHAIEPEGDSWNFYGCICMEAKEISHNNPDVKTLFTLGFVTRRFGSCIQLAEMNKARGFEIEKVGNIYDNPELLK